MIVLVSLAAAIAVSIVVVPIAKTFMSQLELWVGDLYPPDLRLEIKNGLVSINQPEPYIIRLSEEFIEEMRQSGSAAPYENVVVIDTQNTFSYERFAAYNTYAWITGDGLVFVDQDLRAQAVPFGTSTNQVIDRSFVNQWVAIIFQAIDRSLAYIVVIGVLLLMLLFGLFNLAYTALLALIVRLIANNVNRLNLVYHQAWAVTLHLATLGTVWLVIDLCLPGFHLPLGFTIITLVLAYLNLKKVVLPGVPTGSLPSTSLPGTE
jgi:hypothetical protein